MSNLLVFFSSVPIWWHIRKVSDKKWSFVNVSLYLFLYKKVKLFFLYSAKRSFFSLGQRPLTWSHNIPLYCPARVDIWRQNHVSNPYRSEFSSKLKLQIQPQDRNADVERPCPTTEGVDGFYYARWVNIIMGTSSRPILHTME